MPVYQDQRQLGTDLQPRGYIYDYQEGAPFNGVSLVVAQDSQTSTSSIEVTTPAVALLLVYDTQRNGANPVYSYQLSGNYPALQDSNTLEAVLVTSFSMSLSTTRAGQALVSTGYVFSELGLSATQGGNTLSSSMFVVGLDARLVEVQALQASQTVSSSVAAGISLAGMLYPQEANALYSEIFVGGGRDVVLTQGQQGDTVIATMVTARAVRLRFRRGDGTLPAVTTYRYAFWDSPVPDILSAPVQAGTGTIDENGVSFLLLTGSDLLPGEVGYIVVSDTDGSPETPWKQHSGPVRVN